jgi:epoxyqueuosine reductase
VFGCDICQDVCPFNRKAPLTAEEAFQPRRVEGKGEIRSRPEASGLGTKLENRREVGKAASLSPQTLFTPSLEWLAALSEEEYRRVFQGSAIKRAKYQGLVRNACVALGNSAGALTPGARKRISALLERLSASSDVVIAEHAAWALARLAAQGSG